MREQVTCHFKFFSALAVWAEECPPLAQALRPDQCGAALAGFADTPVHGEGPLEIAGMAIGILEIAKRCAARIDGLLECCANGPD